jgi:hypothetical protein
MRSQRSRSVSSSRALGRTVERIVRASSCTTFHVSRTMGRAAWTTALLLALVMTPALAQVPVFPAAPPAVVAVSAPEPSVESGSHLVLDQIAGCVDSGTLRLEIDLRAGRVPVADAWKVEVVGTPTAALVAMAVGGHVSRLDVAVNGGALLLEGNCLRPTMYVDSLHFEEGKGITEASYRGRGIWRPIVWMFRGLATSALHKLEFRTDIPSVLHGNVLGAKGAATPAASGKTPSPSASPAPLPPPGPSFLDLVREVRIHDSEFAAHGDRPLSLGTMVEFHTASQPREGRPVRVAIVAGLFRPAWEGRLAQFEVVGRVDGEIENGAIAFVGSRCSFSHGELREGTFRVASHTGGTVEATISAAALAVDLTEGELHVLGGPRVDVEAPSRFAVRELQLRPDGQYSGIVDAELFGKAGRIERGGVVVSLSDVKLRTNGATIVDGRATGDVALESEYRMDYPLVVRYPVTQVGERRVQLLFQGSLATTLHLQDAGSGEEGTVTGEYRFTVPWPPIEQAAFEVLRAKWMQDIPPVLRKVDFVIEPRRFGPCGGTCFLVGLGVTVEKKEAKGNLFRQICETQGKADLVVDAASRSFLLRNVRIEPRCHGLVGWVVNFLGPFLTKTYTDVTLFQMPENLPFTIESVDSGNDWITIAGKVAWASKAPDAPSRPSRSGRPGSSAPRPTASSGATMRWSGRALGSEPGGVVQESLGRAH